MKNFTGYHKFTNENGTEYKFEVRYFPYNIRGQYDPGYYWSAKAQPHDQLIKNMWHGPFDSSEEAYLAGKS